jgi:predicted 3-demethylubiquinone-9 3-methyltransferase (glyoxalase superfamily)
MPSISHMLWFDTAAKEAADLYTSIFPHSRITNVSQGPDGQVFTVNYEILGESYIALNGGPQFTFNAAFSIFVNCDGQEEVDYYWDAFIQSGGTPGNCGWLTDKFGVSWQIVPKQLGEALSQPDPEKAAAAMGAMMKMSKIIIAELPSQ